MYICITYVHTLLLFTLVYTVRLQYVYDSCCYMYIYLTIYAFTGSNNTVMFITDND